MTISTDLSLLNDPRRQARLLYWQGFAVPQICDMLQLKRPTVQSWKQRDGWEETAPINRVESTLEARLIQLYAKPDLTPHDFKVADFLSRQMERLARVNRYGQTGNEVDLNPNIASRNKGDRKKPKRNFFSDEAIEKLEAPDEVVIPMSLHIGAPCTPIVAVGDTVKLGQKIGEATGFVSSPVHASVSGTVVAVELRPHFNGTDGMAVVIQNDHQDTLSEDVKPVEHPESLSGEQLAEIVKNAGIVGCGGATFPTHVKILGGLGKVDTVIINAAECEPYITSDHRIMLEMPEQLIGGAKLLAQAFGVTVHIGIEDNKMDAVEVLRNEIAKEGGIGKPPIPS